MSRAYRKFVAGIAAAALLFGVLSPVLASLLFSQRTDIMAQVLGVAAPQAAAQGVICHQVGQAATNDGAASVSLQQPEDTSGPAAHSIFCSFCLVSSATFTLPGTPLTVIAVAAIVASLLPAGRVQPPRARRPSTHRSRAPPIPS